MGRNDRNEPNAMAGAELQAQGEALTRAFRESLGCDYAYGGAVLQVTDSQLALLVRRSRSADGRRSFLVNLDVRGQKNSLARELSQHWRGWRERWIRLM